MAIPKGVKSRSWLRTRFENGDTPDQNEWYAIFDSFVHKVEDSHLFNFADIIDDDVTSTEKTWSSDKISTEIQSVVGSISKMKVEFTSATTVTIDHNFDTSILVYKAFYFNGTEYEEFIPSRFRIINSNQAVMEMNPPTTGYVVLMGTPEP